MDLHVQYACEGFEAKKKNLNAYKAESKENAANYKNSKISKFSQPTKFLNKKVKGSATIEDYIVANENHNILNDSDYDADLEKIFDLIKNDK